MSDDSTTESTLAQRVLATYPAETISAIAAAIRKTRDSHPYDASCECEAIEALKVLIRGDEVQAVAEEFTGLVDDVAEVLAHRRGQRWAVETLRQVDFVFLEEDARTAVLNYLTALIDGEEVKGGRADERHPESYCHRCAGPNVRGWAAPSPLWNAAMRGGSINGSEIHDGIVCPTCFAALAEARGIADLWCFSARRVHVELETVTPSGRVWDETTWLWTDPSATEEAEGAT